MKYLAGIFAVLFACLGLMGQEAEPVYTDRVALIIGNATYLSGPLNNTVNDARAMSMALESSGFEVLLHENVTNQNEMKRAVREFGMKLKTGGTALFYYSGHGMQVKGFNYLIPTQAVMNIEQEIEYEALDMGFVLAYMESAKSAVNIVILDACRNNPFARSFRDTKQGLSSMVAPTGTVIAYSTSPGSVASDGMEEYGLYTKALLTHMQRPGVKVEDVFKSVRAEVLDKSQGQQTPWESSSLVGDFYFHAGNQLLTEAPQTHITSYTYPADKPESQAQTETSQASLQKATYQVPQQGSVIPMDAVKHSGIKIRFKWRATSDGTYYLRVGSQEISTQTVYELRGDHLYVYHQATNRVFILKSFVLRMDGIWRNGTTYD
ncbi:MAG: caspase family protein [Bacteroidota bacterium]